MHLHDDVRGIFYKILSSSERFTSFPLMWWSEVYSFLNIRFETILKKFQLFLKCTSLDMLKLPRNL